MNGTAIEANYRGFYNIYNILAAYAAGKEAGLKLTAYNRVLRKYSPENGRNEASTSTERTSSLTWRKIRRASTKNISAVMEDTKEKDLNYPD